MTQIDLEEWLTSSQEDIPASPSRLPGSDEAIKMTDTSGRRCLELSKLSGPAGSLEKMLLATSLWASTRCYLTWKAQATPAGATLFRLSPQTPRTDETDAGLWPTATTQDNPQVAGQGKAKGTKRGTTLGGAVRLWPTPAANKTTESGELINSDGTPWDGIRKPHSKKTGKQVQTALTDAVRLWPTPTAHNHKEGGFPAEYTRNTPTLTAEATEADGKPHSSGSLNPEWVEWLMGYPVGYTDLNS